MGNLNSLSKSILNVLENDKALKEYRRKVSNRKGHIFSGNKTNLKASIINGISIQRNKRWKISGIQETKLDAAIEEYLARLYNIVSKPSSSKKFSYEMLPGSSSNNFKVLVTGDGNIEAHIQLIRDKANLNKLSNQVKNLFNDYNGKNTAIDLGHVGGSTIAEQYAKVKLMQYESVGGMPLNTTAYETLKTVIKYDPLGHKLATVEVEDQFWRTNQSTTEEAQIMKLLEEAIGSKIKSEIPSLAQSRINKISNTIIDGAKKSGAKSVPKKQKVESGGTKVTNTKKDLGNVKIIGKSQVSLNVPVPKEETATYNWSSVLRIINAKLPLQVAKNMVSPRLVFRTGKFASSTQVVGVTATKEGYPSFTFDYERDPYNVFDKYVGASPWNTPERDPRALVDMSLREILRELAIKRFYTRRA